MKRFVSIVVVALLLGAGVWGYLYAQGRNSSPKYRLVQVEQGPLTAAVSATGNLNAVIIVQVGSQVSGQIKELLVDFNSVVKKGQTIARIDPQIFEAQVNQAKADVETAKAAVLNQAASVEKARADVENARAALAQGKAQTAKADAAQADSKRIFDRNAELFNRQLIAQADRDTAQANYEQAVAQSESSRASEKALAANIDSSLAQLRVQEAALKSAHAQVDQKTAALAQAQTNLDYTTIRAPVDGIVVSRAVDVGQTVAASLQAPTLFTIAQDLTKMQVETSVDEADIGRVKLEDRATFTVDAFSGQTFSGIVTQIRKAAQIVQNVVTYTVVISVDNPGGRLLPGMTANVKLVYAEKPSVLKVPNAALRFRPAGADAGPVGSTRGQGGVPSAGPPAAGQAPRGDVAGGGRSPGEMRERLVTGLGLSAEQQKKLDPILADTRQQMMALRGLPEGERQARAATIREATRAKIREILPPEQRAKYEELAGREGRSAGAAPAFGGGGNAGRVWILDTDGKPKAVALTLGLSDGTATEVLRGDLKEGQEVITGLAAAGQQNRPGTSGSTPGGPRLRL
ncbi:MAG: HlyD family secretion protein [Candidatus Rokuibacteriota bacterium]|nr:MAG: HlyD family secretion protein [Candidatus Rokubacteria bacterium]